MSLWGRKKWEGNKGWEEYPAWYEEEASRDSGDGALHPPCDAPGQPAARGQLQPRALLLARGRGDRVRGSHPSHRGCLDLPARPPARPRTGAASDSCLLFHVPPRLLPGSHKALSPRDCKASWGKHPALGAAPCELQLFSEDLPNPRVCHSGLGTVPQHNRAEKCYLKRVWEKFPCVLKQSKERAQEEKHICLYKQDISGKMHQKLVVAFFSEVGSAELGAWRERWTNTLHLCCLSHF